MAVSADGFVARGPNDDMKWTGPDDKGVFRLLTTLGFNKLFVGRRTFDLMPPLPDRIVHPISNDLTKGYSLEEAATYRDAWLLGGQSIALEALTAGYLSEIVLCMNQTKLDDGIRLDSRLANFGSMVPPNPIQIGSIAVMMLRR